MSKKIVSVLKKDVVIIGVFTNSLAAYNQLHNCVPVHEQSELPSYSTVNRVVRNPGDLKNFTTSVGAFSIQKMTLFKKAF